MASTYDPIASTTLTSSASSVTFSSLDTIAAGYRDLVLVVANVGNNLAQLRFNADSGSNYSTVYAAGDGASSYSGTNTTTYINPFAVTFGNPSIFQIMDFATTNKHKSVLIRNNSSSFGVEMATGRWANTAAITEITIVGYATFAAGSVFSLYGIVA